MKKLKNTGAYAYLFPSFLIFGIFLFYPFFKTLYLSLFKTNKMGQAKLFVGLGNYKELLQSSSFWNSLAVTLIFVVIVVAVSMILGLTTAVLCNKTFPGIRFFSTAYALPMAIASSSAAMIFKIMLHPSVGIINKIFHLDINWVSDPKYALICVAVLTAWLNSGINFLYFSAGLSNIDETIYERASRRRRKFIPEILPPDTSGTGTNDVLHISVNIIPGIPVIRTGQDSDTGWSRRIHKPDRVFHLQRCLL